MTRSQLAGCLTGLVVLVVAVPATASAQEATNRGGFWLGGGIGVGHHEETGGSAYLRMGGTLGERLVLGGESLALAHDEGDASVSRGNLTVVALFYPSSRAGLFLKAGVGFASIEKEVSGVTDEGQPVVVTTTDEQGLGTTVGVGYDIQLGGGNLYLTPNLDALVQYPNDGLSDPEAGLLLTLGIGFR